jgi:hypothetical protein
VTRIVIAAALASGAGFGIVGSIVPAGPSQDAAWFVSSLGLILGCVVLALRHLAEGRDLAAGGFFLVALGETIMQAAQGGADGARLAAFARGAGTYVPGLLLLAWSDRYAAWLRLTCAAAAVPFAVHASLYFVGLEPTEQGSAATLGYALLTAAVVGWLVALYRPRGEGSFATARRGERPLRP